MKFITYYDSPFGKITLAGDEAGLCGLWFEGEKSTRTLSRQAEKTTNSARVILRQKQIPLRERVATRKVNALEAKSGADKKRGSADLLAKEQYGASETQRDIAALKKSEESDFAAKAANGADGKFCAHTLIESEKFFTRDFAAQDAGKDLARPIFRRKARVENSARTSKTSKADTSRRKTWSFSIKLGAGSICILADASRVLRLL